MAALGKNYGGLGNQAIYATAEGAIGQIQATKVRTVSSAIGRVDDLNCRLAQVLGNLSQIADQIGGPRPVAGVANGPELADGAVGRLNDAVDHAHTQVNELEELLATIGRALG